MLISIVGFDHNWDRSIVTESNAKSKREGKTATHTAISRKVVGKNMHATIPKANMSYVEYTVPDTVAVEPTFVAFL